HLVASSVEDLNSQEITVVDAKGNILSKPGGDVAGLSASQFDYQSGYSKDLEARIISILEPVVGKGKVRAKVSAVVDFTRSETTEEKFDPESQVVRSEQKQNEKSTTVGAGGTPGVASNLPGKTTVAATPSQGLSEKQSQTVNYEMTKITSRTVNAPGLVKKLTAAVLVDGTYAPQQGSKEMKYTPRSEEDVRRYEELVRETMGFTESRGDQIKVVNMPFEVAREEEVLPPKTKILEMAAPAARYALPLLAVILLVVFVLRPVAQSLSASGSNFPRGPVPIAQAFAEIENAGVRKELPARAQVADWARKNPTDAANVIKSWMQ
ncbi:MAG TPA: flagellar basal-body MS-ring/collar protein FliF, partial [Candidatus Deferrimicrobium sp.]